MALLSYNPLISQICFGIGQPGSRKRISHTFEMEFVLFMGCLWSMAGGAEEWWISVGKRRVATLDRAAAAKIHGREAAAKRLDQAFLVGSRWPSPHRGRA
jgi:hypothetical protein